MESKREELQQALAGLGERGQHRKNATQRSLRGAVVRRKNHYGSRSRCGTEVAALFYTLIESAKLVGVGPRTYLRAAAEAALRNGAMLLPSAPSDQPRPSRRGPARTCVRPTGRERLQAGERAGLRAPSSTRHLAGGRVAAPSSRYPGCPLDRPKGTRIPRRIRGDGHALIRFLFCPEKSSVKKQSGLVDATTGSRM